MTIHSLFYLLVSFFLLLMLSLCGLPAANVAENAATHGVLPYPPYPGAVASPDYTVTVNEQPVFVHNHYDGLTTESRMGYAHFAMYGKVTVCITYKHGLVNSCDVSPKAYNKKATIHGDAVTLTLDKPQYLIVFINKKVADNFSNDGLILFADPPEEKPLKIGDKNVVNIMDYTIDNTGKMIETTKINQAISDVAAKLGGGVVFFPRGVYRSGTIRMKSHVTLYVDGGALIHGCDVAAEYPRVTTGLGWGGACQLFFDNVQNAVIRGRGTIDFSSSDAPLENGPNTYAVRCAQGRNIEFRDAIFRRSRQWTLDMYDTEYFHTKNLKLLNRKKGLFDDVYDLCGCRHVLIENGFAMAVDDMFALKSGYQNKPIEDIVVNGFVAYGADSGLAIGYDPRECQFKYIKGVTLQNVHFVASKNDWALWIGFEPERAVYGGGYWKPLEDLSFINCTFEDGGAINIGGGGSHFRNFSFINCTIYEQNRDGFLHAYFTEPIVIKNLTIRGEKITNAHQLAMAGTDILSPVTFLPAKSPWKASVIPRIPDQVKSSLEILTKLPETSSTPVPGRVRLILENTDSHEKAQGRMQLANGLTPLEGTAVDYLLKPGETVSKEIDVTFAPGLTKLQTCPRSMMLQPANIDVIIKIPLARIDGLETPEQVTKALATQPALTIARDGKMIATVKLAVSGENLAFLGQTIDPIIAAGQQPWDGSEFEIFGTMPGNRNNGQVFLLSGTRFMPPVGVKLANRQLVATEEIRLASAFTTDGYEISALIPLKLLVIEPGAKTFRLEMQPDTYFAEMLNKRNAGPRMYTALFGSGSPATDNSSYGYFSLE